MTNAEKRLKLLDKMKDDKNQLAVGEVIEIFGGCLDMQIKHSQTFKNVKKKLTQEEWDKFLHALSISFTTSLYCSASKNEEQLLERTKEVQDANSDILIGAALKQDKKGADA